MCPVNWPWKWTTRSQNHATNDESRARRGEPVDGVRQDQDRKAGRRKGVRAAAGTRGSARRTAVRRVGQDVRRPAACTGREGHRRRVRGTRPADPHEAHEGAPHRAAGDLVIALMVTVYFVAAVACWEWLGR